MSKTTRYETQRMENTLADCERILDAIVQGDMPHGSILLAVRKDIRAILRAAGGDHA